MADLTSTVVATMAYDPDTSRLVVEETSGDIWLYSDVPPQLAVAFEAAPSKGTFYHRALAHTYPRRKLPAMAHCEKCGDVGVEGCGCDCCGCAVYGYPS